MDDRNDDHAVAGVPSSSTRFPPEPGEEHRAGATERATSIPPPAGRDVVPEDLVDDLPAVGQFPTVKTVRATFTVVGRIQPMPLPDPDDGHP